MKIWIDFANTPQVSFWVPFIREFQNEKHELLLTCRSSGNTIELLKQQDLEFTIVGDGVGKGAARKILFFTKRLIKLFFFIFKNRPDIAISQSSFYQPPIAWLFRIPSLYTNDNEHAKGNIFGFLFATKVILPVALKEKPFTNKWPLKNKVSFYPSVKEAIYLSQQPDYLETNNTKSIIFYRPEPWTAQYYKGPINFFDSILVELADKNEIVILSRDNSQTKHYKRLNNKNISVAEKPIPFKEILTHCRLFIGAGGSMTRELAVMSINPISIYQEEILCVDKYIVDHGLMVIKPDISFNEIQKVIEQSTTINTQFSLLEEGKVSFKIIKNLIYKLIK